MNSKAETAKLIGVMAAAYPNIQVSDATVELYVNLLNDILCSVLAIAVQQCLAESEFLPTIAKLRDKAIALTSQENPAPLEAWGTVLTEIKRTGFYHSPRFENPIIAKAVDCIGWQYLCSSENQVADRAHFAKVYESLLRRDVEDQKLLPAARQLKAGVPVAAMLTEGR